MRGYLPGGRGGVNYIAHMERQRLVGAGSGDALMTLLSSQRWRLMGGHLFVGGTSRWRDQRFAFIAKPISVGVSGGRLGACIFAARGSVARSATPHRQPYHIQTSPRWPSAVDQSHKLDLHGPIVISDPSAPLVE